MIVALNVAGELELYNGHEKVCQSVAWGCINLCLFELPCVFTIFTCAMHTQLLLAL